LTSAHKEKALFDARNNPYVKNKHMSKTKKIEPITSIPIKDDEYVKLVSHISDLWDDARNKAFQAVNTSLLMANWHTGE
jgi:hypothetical protein